MSETAVLGMKWNKEGSARGKSVYTFARSKFQNSGTKEAIKGKIDGMKDALKQGKKNDYDDKIGRYKAAIARQEKKLDK